MERETKRPDLNVLAMEVHANAVQHGWWESTPAMNTALRW